MHRRVLPGLDVIILAFDGEAAWWKYWGGWRLEPGNDAKGRQGSYWRTGPGMSDTFCKRKPALAVRRLPADAAALFRTELGDSPCDSRSAISDLAAAQRALFCWRRAEGVLYQGSYMYT